MLDSQSISLNYEAKAPFDVEAKDYDDRFSKTTLGLWLREQVWERLLANFKPGDHVLELGCGTGEDTLWLAKKGIRVTATDCSKYMLTITQKKIAQENLGHLVNIKYLDLNHPEAHFESRFDGIFSNFGVLNCVQNRNRLAIALSNWIRSGGRVVFVIMNPICPWEIIWHLLHAQFGKSLRRLRKNGVLVTLSGGSKIQVWYPSPKLVKSEFGRYFKQVGHQGLGIFLPPTYLQPWIERFPRVLNKLLGIEKHLTKKYPWNWLNDHYVLELIRN